MVDSQRPSARGDSSFRREPPAAETQLVFVPPQIQETRLSNGLRILWAERHHMPIVALQIVVDRSFDLQNAPGIATLTAAMMFTGTESRTALTLSDDLEVIGARAGAWADKDGMGVSGQVLQNQFPDLLEILADVVRRPSFSAEELERERAKRLSLLAAERDVPDSLLEDTVEAILYPEGHPFHAPALGDEASIGAVQVEDLRRLHQLAFRPAHATVAIAGDIDPAVAIEHIEKYLGDWTGAEVPRKTPPEPRILTKSEPRVYLLDRPGASQSNVTVALVGISRKNQDYDAAMVLNTLFGGQFSSRLNMNLREKHAYSYGAYSLLAPRKWAGPWTAGGAVTTSATASAIREIFIEIERLRNELVPEVELSNAKTNLIRKLPSRFETAAGTVQALASLSSMDLPLDSFALRQSRAARVTAEDVLRVARTYLRPDDMRIFVVGDAALVRDDLEKLELGPIEVRSTQS
ncbi:MAG TPA: pitrilysin family protein [Polyangium sp.]|nr:pitrilysin family protein [Polyangium sp.]